MGNDEFTEDELDKIGYTNYLTQKEMNQIYKNCNYDAREAEIMIQKINQKMAEDNAYNNQEPNSIKK